MDEETYSELAKADFTMKIVTGTIIGALAFIVGIILTIIFFVKGESPFAWMFVGLALVGLIVAGIDGYLLFSRKK